LKGHTYLAGSIWFTGVSFDAMVSMVALRLFETASVNRRTATPTALSPISLPKSIPLELCWRLVFWHSASTTSAAYRIWGWRGSRTTSPPLPLACHNIPLHLLYQSRRAGRHGRRRSVLEILRRKTRAICSTFRNSIVLLSKFRAVEPVGKIANAPTRNSVGPFTSVQPRWLHRFGLSFGLPGHLLPRDLVRHQRKPCSVPEQQSQLRPDRTNGSSHRPDEPGHRCQSTTRYIASTHLSDLRRSNGSNVQSRASSFQRVG
jgi:hypothetical protein